MIDESTGFDIEVKTKHNVVGSGELCSVSRCDLPAVHQYIVGKVRGYGGMEINLCESHDGDDRALEEYEDGEEE